MLQLGISQAQTQFTKLLTQTVIIIDKKSHKKKAVIMPYEEYKSLTKKQPSKHSSNSNVFDQFLGILSKDYATNDKKYNKITK